MESERGKEESSIHVNSIHMRQAGAGTIIERRVEGRKSRGTYEVIVEVDRQTEKRGRPHRVSSSRSLKTRRPSKTVVSCGGRESRDGRQGTGSRRAKKGRRSAKSPSRREGYRRDDVGVVQRMLWGGMPKRVSSFRGDGTKQASRGQV